MLAEIIVSANVGEVHLQRAGEVLVARAKMNSRILAPGTKSRISGDRLDELLFSIADAEDAYIEAWQACETGTKEWRDAEGLAALDISLNRATDYFRAVASQE
ncbi:hypothetical protein [Kitasatospora purpeofusca]|uniref:hypothetical protein n=1 Tax=Kitasatospora purpeofusca TaxID=67352 RepID=UPI00225A5047|nr:hypothetical protein [Kitasatospora purpeofusca]MCX4758260.1 hypothetical protein [Kitasatospora purpeofusca]WSR31281.1 hypothetical protein OG715_09990 [Kitasatospora purpeofusca]